MNQADRSIRARLQPQLLNATGRVPNNLPMARKDRVKWREPYGVSMRRGAEAVRALGLVKPGFWTRTVGLGFAVAGVMIGLFVWAYPGTPLPWVRMLTAPLAIVPVLLYGVASSIFVPCWIEMRPTRVMITSGAGSPTHRIKRRNRSERQMESIELFEDEHDAWWLFVRSRSLKGPARESLHAVATRADIDAIRALTAHLAAAIEESDPPKSDADPATAHLGTRLGDFKNRSRL